jgi:hypothetical protein
LLSEATSVFTHNYLWKSYANMSGMYHIGYTKACLFPKTRRIQREFH